MPEDQTMEARVRSTLTLSFWPALRVRACFYRKNTGAPLRLRHPLRVQSSKSCIAPICPHVAISSIIMQICQDDREMRAAGTPAAARRSSMRSTRPISPRARHYSRGKCSGSCMQTAKPRRSPPNCTHLRTGCLSPLIRDNGRQPNYHDL